MVKQVADDEEDVYRDSIANQIINRVHARTGCDLAILIAKQIESWCSNPMGFKFELKGGNMGWITLYNTLFLNHKFCKDCGLGAKFQSGHSFREISEDGSAHIILMYDKPNDSYKEKTWYVNAHLDSISCVTRRRRNSVCCEYDLVAVVDHYGHDQKHWW